MYYDVMLAKDGFKAPREWFTGWDIQEKLSGIRAHIIKKGNQVSILGKTYIHKQRVDFTEQLPEIVNYFQGALGDFIIDVELMNKGSANLYLVAFDVLQMDEQDFVHSKTPLHIRNQHLLELKNRFPNEGIFRLVTSHGPVRCGQDIEDTLKMLTESGGGGEGLILKDPYGAYLPGVRRNSTWAKILPYQEMEVIFYDVIEGVGKYAGMLGSLKAVRYLGDSEEVHFKVGVGFGEGQRAFYWNTHKAGRVQLPIKGKIKYLNVSSIGMPKTPVFLRFLDDWVPMPADYKSSRAVSL